MGTIDLLIDEVDSEIGVILVVSDGQSLCALDYADYEQRMTTLLRARFRDFHLKRAANPLGISDRVRAYLDGDCGCLAGIPVNTGGTTFQRQVWSALRGIPPGAVVTYGELAAKLGKPTACRAVGAANALNPVAIAVPCHRVIGARAQLTGYAGGLARKRWLLQHEGVDLTRLQADRARSGARS